MELTKKNRDWERFPLWLLLLGIALVFALVKIASDDEYTKIARVVFAGLGLSLKISLQAYIGSLVLGFIVGLMRSSRSYVLRQIALLYTETLRGIPMLVVLLVVAYVATPIFVGVLNAAALPLLRLFHAEVAEYTTRDISYTQRTVLALILGYSAYIAEIVRAGIQSIPKGQYDAASALGCSRTQIMLFIVIPQAFRNVFPALINELLALVKDSSLASFLGVREITQNTKLYATSTFLYMESYGIAALIYLCITLTLSLLVKLVERYYPPATRLTFTG